MKKKNTDSLESATRKKIDQILINLEWNTDEFSQECNVFTERVKTKEQTQLLKKISGYKKPPDYVLYESDTDIPIAIIEAKRIGQSLEGEIRVSPIKYSKILTKTVQKNNATSGRITVPVEYVDTKVIVLFPNNNEGDKK